MTDLLPDQRRNHIVEQARQNGAVRVTELAAALEVAEETVRRDLKLLDEIGLLTRTHGGAVRHGEPAALAFPPDLPFEQRRRAMLPEKAAIAQAALARIPTGATIALDGSTTAYELATLLRDPEMTVVTNSLVIINLLAGRPGVRVIAAGGSLDRDLMIFTGMIALEGLRRLHVEQFFCSCGQADARRGFSDPSETAAHFKRELIALADQTIVLADSTKFASRAPVVFAEPAEVVELITDVATPPGTLTAFTDTGLKVAAVTPAGQDR